MAVTDFKIPDDPPRVQWVATAGQQVFPIPFRFFTNNDIKVYINASDTPVSASDYSLTGAGTNADGELTFDVGQTEDDLVTIVRESVIERVVNFLNSGDWKASNVNDQLNRLTTFIQEVKLRAIDLALTLPITSKLTGITIPDDGATVNANRVLCWNPAGTQLANGPLITELATVTNNIEDINTVADFIDEVVVVSTNINSVNSTATNMAAIIAAPDHATDAINAKDDAIAAKNLAQDWASKAEDDEVMGGLYSAFHYMKKAQESIGSVKVSANDTTPNTLLAKLVAGSAVILTEQNNGANENIKIDIDLQTNTNYASAPNSLNSYFYMNQDSNRWHVPYGGLLNAISLLTEDTSPDLANDFVLTHDTSAAAAKKVRANKFTSRVLLATVTASGSAQLDFTGIDGTYDRYEFEFIDLKPNSDTNIGVRVSDNNGTTFDSAASDYSFGMVTQPITNTITGYGTSSSSIMITGGVNAWGGAAGEAMSGLIKLFKPSAASFKKRFIWHISGEDTAGNEQQCIGHGSRNNTDIINAVRFYPHVGNFTSGQIKMYGIK